MKLEVSGGCYRYPRVGRPILSEITFSAGGGDVLAVLGPNGAGKTTLLRCMMGLAKWDSGETCIDGVSIRELSHQALWKKLAYVPQARQALAAYTVEDMVLLGRTSSMGLFSLPGKEDYRAADRVMDRLGLSGLRGRSCAELSGGEFQMVLIARALVSAPEILVLDEPESNLDFKNQLLVLDTVSALAEEGVCCIMTTHYPAHALRRANKALMLSREGTFRFGEAGAVITEKSLREFFGVRSVIGTVETPERLYADVIPVSIGGDLPEEPDPEQTVIAGVTVILPGDGETEQMNRIIHQYSGLLIGRMGLPCREAGVNLINLTLEAPRKDVMAMTEALARLPGVSAKATYASEVKEHGRKSPDRPAES